MTPLSTSPVLLRTFTDKELYRLAFHISEELVSREQSRIWAEFGDGMARESTEEVQRRLAIARPTRRPVSVGGFDDASDNYGGW